VLAAAGLEWKEPTIAKRMHEQRLRLDRMRVALGSLADEVQTEGARSAAVVPRRRVVRVRPEQPSPTA
jgi:hypothetical protein